MTLFLLSHARRIRVAAFAGLALLASAHALGQKNYWSLTEADLRLLPPFCRTGFSFLSASDAANMNHLCPGLNALNDAQRSFGDSTRKGWALSQAIDHLSYTLRHPNPSHPLRPMVLVKRGNAYELQGNISKAITDYSTAVRVNPKFLQGYVSLSNAYVKLGDKKSALNALDEGLKANPDSKPLQSRRQQLAGS